MADTAHSSVAANAADIWELLNQVAFEGEKRRGGRASVSALLVDLVERHRKGLEKELIR